LRGVQSTIWRFWFGNEVAFTYVMNTDKINIDTEREWRRLCQLAANETNPQRLSELVDQILRALDARTQALRNRDRQAQSFPGFPTGAED
jgi:hypothetical protein